MTILNVFKSLERVFFLFLYYSFARHLPPSSYKLGGGRLIRVFCAKHLFEFCGKNVNIERKAFFGSGRKIRIGDYSGLGINCHIPNDTVIGNYVMMGPNCYILRQNHMTKDFNRPMIFQGFSERKQTIIGDDVWIGRDVLMTPGRVISNGTIIAGGCVLTKDFPEYSVVGGNPSRLLKSRKGN